MQGDDEPRGDDYIVSFKSYLRPDRAHQIVHDALHGQRGCATAGAWRVLPRHNAAYRLPSDFALVRLQLTRAHRRRALRALRRHSSVRLISPERRYGPSEPMPSKGLQSHAEQEPSPRHAEAASLSEPAHSPDSCLESGADAVCLDLEDAVAPADKASARAGALEFLAQRGAQMEHCVRAVARCARRAERPKF